MQNRCILLHATGKYMNGIFELTNGAFWLMIEQIERQFILDV